jgi:hypothetical protein
LTEFAFDTGPPFPRRIRGRVLACPDGFEWDAWNPSIVCRDCGIVFSAVAPTVAMEQQRYDEMAAAHRPRCPGDGA